MFLKKTYCNHQLKKCIIKSNSKKATEENFVSGEKQQNTREKKQRHAYEPRGLNTGTY